MLETELLDHIEKTAHRQEWSGLSLPQAREWYQKNVTIEDRLLPPNENPYLRRLYSAGINTTVRHP